MTKPNWSDIAHAISVAADETNSMDSGTMELIERMAKAADAPRPCPSLANPNIFALLHDISLCHGLSAGPARVKLDNFAERATALIR